MQVFVSGSGRSRKPVVKTLLAAACGMGLMLSTTVDHAEAAKGGSVKGQTTGTSKANPSPVVRDHRGEGTVRPPPRPPCYKPGGCSRPWGWGYGKKPGTVVRDHRDKKKGSGGPKG